MKLGETFIWPLHYSTKGRIWQGIFENFLTVELFLPYRAGRAGGPSQTLAACGGSPCPAPTPPWLHYKTYFTKGGLRPPLESSARKRLAPPGIRQRGGAPLADNTYYKKAKEVGQSAERGREPRRLRWSRPLFARPEGRKNLCGRSNQTEAHNKIQISPPLPSLMIRSKVSDSFTRDASGICASFEWIPSPTSS